MFSYVCGYAYVQCFSLQLFLCFNRNICKYFCTLCKLSVCLTFLSRLKVLRSLCHDSELLSASEFQMGRGGWGALQILQGDKQRKAVAGIELYDVIGY